MGYLKLYASVLQTSEGSIGNEAVTVLVVSFLLVLRDTISES